MLSPLQQVGDIFIRLSLNRRAMIFFFFFSRVIFSPRLMRCPFSITDADVQYCVDNVIILFTQKFIHALYSAAQRALSPPFAAITTIFAIRRYFYHAATTCLSQHTPMPTVHTPDIH